MQSEEFDKKLREAAEGHHPAYDEQAWMKMHSLLNKHLPEKKDNRRRFIFFLLLFLLLGSGAMLVINNSSGKKKQITSVKDNYPVENIAKQQQDQPESAEQGNKTFNQDQTVNTGGNEIPSAASTQLIKISPRVYQDALQTTFVKNKKRLPVTEDPPVIALGKIKSMAVSRVNNDQPAASNSSNSDMPVSGNIIDPAIPATATSHETTANEKEENREKPNHTTLSSEKENNPVPLTDKTSAKNKKEKPSGKSNFFFSVSSSVDVSFATGEQTGTMKLLTGAGAGFIFKNNIMVRTGFYSGRKIYSASPSAYHPPASFWSYYPYLQNVEADCKVYEIPVSVSYLFGRSEKQNWFASAGISSYLMKKEKYTYYYKQTQWGPTYNRDWTIKNENNHLFSVLTFSGGYQRKLSDKFFVMAEPYFKLPLSGVGFGKVKLNSAGLQLTAGFIPFSKKKTTPDSK